MSYENFMNYSWDGESSMGVNTEEPSDLKLYGSPEETQATDWGYLDGFMGQSFLPGIDPLDTGSQLFEDEPQPSVQSRTERSHSYKNRSILSMDNQPPFNPPTYRFEHDSPPVPSQPALLSPPHSYPQELTWIEDGPVSGRAPTMGTYMPLASSNTRAGGSMRNHRQLRHCKHPGCSRAYETDKGLSRHARTHQPPDPKAKCHHCGQQLSRTDVLRRHERACQECLGALREGSR